MTATVVHKHEVNNLDGRVVYIGRGSPWGNPYLLPGLVGGSKIRTMAGLIVVKTIVVADRETAIAMYRQLLWQELNTHHREQLLHELARLDGLKLACYCAPKPCHGDVLAAAATWAKTQLSA
jgi:hypothetical protein